MKTKHYYYFKDFEFSSLNKENWDKLRTNNTNDHFSIEKTQNDYEENCERSIEYKKSAQVIVDLLKKYKLDNKLVSLGCGKGILEYHIKKICPYIFMKCTDYTEKGIELLRKVFVNCDEFLVFDMLNQKEYNLLQTDRQTDRQTVILYRLSTEFSIEKWKKIFDYLYDAEVDNIIFVPSDASKIEDIIKAKIFNVINFVRGRKETFCGWLYSEGEYNKMFRGNGKKRKYVIKEIEHLDKMSFYLLSRV